MSKNEEELTEIFAGELWQVSIVKGLLESNEIITFIENESIGVISPWQNSAAGFKPVKLKVNRSNLEVANEILKNSAL